jgi:hypothetical protein
MFFFNKDFRWWYVGIEIGFWNFTETTYTFDITGVTVTFECCAYKTLTAIT